MARGYTADTLARDVVRVLQNVLTIQRTRWSPLMEHRRQYEAWFKAEFAIALENWCLSFTLPLPSRYFAVLPEAKPKLAQLSSSSKAIDLAVIPWSDEKNDYDFLATPRVWLELKQRAHWWGSPSKALGTSNDGLASDLVKWDKATWDPRGDVVLACHLFSYIGKWNEKEQTGLKKEWLEQFEMLPKNHGMKPFCDPYHVACPLTGTGDDAIVRWLRMDVVQIHPRK